MKRLSARHLLSYSTEQLWDILIGDFILVFDDKIEIKTNYRHTLYSSYFWDFHRTYTETPLKYTHHVHSVVGDGYFGSNTHINLLSKIYWDVAEVYHMDTPIDRDHITKMVYLITNEIYNDLSVRLEDFVLSIDITDFIQVTQHPELKEILDNPEPTREYITGTYDKILKTIYKDPELNDNSLVKCTRFRTVNENQVLQCVGPRGYMTEVDSLILPVPVLRSYTKGKRTMYNTIVESRSAAKSLYFSDKNLKDVEFFARRLQLLTMYVEKVEYMDCGSTNYIPWKVKPPIFKDDKRIYPGDLPYLEGKWYLDPDTNTLKAITIKDTHLFGTIIQMRSVVTCNHPNPSTICSVCFGKLADNLMPGANVGHVCAAIMTQKTTQSILGAKHLDANSLSEPVVLTDNSQKYFTTGPCTSSYYINSVIMDKKPQLVVNPAEAFALTDIMLVKNIYDLNIGRVSKITGVAIILTTDNSTIKYPVNVTQKTRCPILTSEFLEYCKIIGWSTDDAGNFIIDISHWDVSKPIMRLPDMEYSYAQNSSQIAETIESRIKELGKRLKKDSVISTLVELFDLVNSKLFVNISILEVIIYAYMVKDGYAFDYSLSRNGPNASMGVSIPTLRGRSLGPAYASSDQSSLITNPNSYYKLNRPDNILDVYICPNEVVKHRKQ